MCIDHQSCKMAGLPVDETAFGPLLGIKMA
jgi:hypothetical protein